MHQIGRFSLAVFRDRGDRKQRVLQSSTGPSCDKEYSSANQKVAPAKEKGERVKKASVISSNSYSLRYSLSE
jgi:hypothetical protein